ncbi:hypothetical protein P4B35_00455 [Pontiellaceae bacterium B12227]|nr:hypothetical protein [Pontiellaceae bacterium B12227]
MKKIAYYITAHGYGHGTRSCDVLNAIRRADSEVPIIVKTDLPTDFMASRLLNGIELRTGAFDLGLIQKDSIHVDLEASIQAITQLYAHEKKLIEQEKKFLLEEEIGVVVADIPAIPLAAAQAAGIPNIGCSNFGWNWIYSEFADADPRWQVFVDKFQAVYEKTDLLLRQPFSESMSSFPHIIDLPLLAYPGTNRRALIAETYGADPSKPWVLLSFTSLNLDFQALEKLKSLSGFELFTVEPLSWPDSGIHSISRQLSSFADVMASVDLVVTKPGFGVVSECIANNKPIIYSDRKNFLEYPVLVDSIERYCRYAFIPNAELYAGDLGRALEIALNASPPKEQIERGGAEKAAREILKRLK